MVGVGVRLEDPVDLKTLLRCRGEDRVGGLGRSLAACMIVVEHRVDNCPAPRLRITN